MVFHGAFGSKAAATRKKKRIRGAFVRTVRMRGGRRYVVMTRRQR